MGKAKAHKVNPYWTALTLLRLGDDLASLTRMLRAIGQEIEFCCSGMKYAVDLGPEEYADGVVDKENEVIEEFLGDASVICQNQITHVVSIAMPLHRECPTLGTTDGTKEGIMRLGTKLTSTSKYSRIEVLDALANYFKHRDEWHRSWAKLDKRSKPTADIITQAGAREHYSGNFRDVCSNLGVSDYYDLGPLEKIVRDWRDTVIDLYEKEFKAKGLI